MLSKKLPLIIVLSIISFISSNCKDRHSDKLSAFTKSIEYESNKKYDLALAEMEKIKDELSDDYFTNLRLGWLYYNNKKYQESIKFYNKAFSLSYNKSVEALLGLTYPYDALSKTDEVITAYKKVLEIDNNNYTANLKLAIIYYYKANYQTAKNFLDKIYPLYSSDYYINLYYGWTLFKLNNKSKAKEYFINALINNPNDASAKEGLEACR
jgi:tetratricopeptide (TPR) repeat protein